MKKTKLIFLINILFILISNFAFTQITSKKSGSWNSASTWSTNQVPASTDDVLISDGHTVFINSNANCRNLTIGTGGITNAELQLNSSSLIFTINGNFLISSNGSIITLGNTVQDIYVAGNFTNNGSFSQGIRNTFHFNGTTNQGIYGNPAIFYDLEINNNSGVKLYTDVTVNDILTLTNGLFYTNNKVLTIAGSISVTSPGSSRMIVTDDGTNFGSLKILTSTNKAYLFPIGDTRGVAEYSPKTITLTSGAVANAYIEATVKNIKDPNNYSTTNYLNRLWTITSTGLTSFSYDIDFNYLNTDVSGTESLIYFAKYDAGAWTLLGQPNTITNKFAVSGLTSFSTFTGGESGALPVQLQSLYSSVSGRNVTINWKTAWENNNKGFEILRAASDKNGNSGNYEIIGFVNGNGTTTEQKAYSFSDKNLNTGKYKYRIKQIDNNGNFEFFNLNGYIEIGVPNKFSVSQNYPNPFNPSTKIGFELPKDGKVSLTIYDITGREAAKVLNNEFRNAGYHTVEFNGGYLSSGVYLYRLNAENETEVKKMTLLK